MNKTSTLKFFTFLSRALLVIVIVFSSAFIHPDLANAANGGTIQAKTIKCYPNPAVSFVNFDFPADYVSKNYMLQVYSFTGKKMYEVSVTSGKAILTFTNDFYRGIYIYQLQDKTGKIIETGKFQVTR
ncbi:MAG: T9SS type A sorting domain-containing protein [Parafilimonas sp.]